MSHLCIATVVQRYIGPDIDDNRQLFDLIEKMLEYEPAQRIHLSEAVSQHPFFHWQRNPPPTSPCPSKPAAEAAAKKVPPSGAVAAADSNRTSLSPASLINSL